MPAWGFGVSTKFLFLYLVLYRWTISEWSRLSCFAFNKRSYPQAVININVTNHAVAPWTNSPSIYKVWVKNSPHRQLRIARSAKFFLHLDKGELGKPKSRKILCTPTKKLTVRRQFVTLEKFSLRRQ